MDVCVIGAGPAGIVAAKVLLQNGFDVTVVDKNTRVGGIWAPGGCYDGLSNQASRQLFEFADLPSGLHYGSAVDSRRYLERYAATFGVSQRVRFETEATTVRAVSGAEPLGSDGWVVGFRPVGGTTTEHETFGHVVVASGAHHHPHVPDLPGRDSFPGTVPHSNDVRAGTFDGRRVVVVGGGKSALDLVLRAAREGLSATLVQRKVNWMVPQRLLLGTVGYKWILMTRLGEALLPRYDNEACVRLLDRTSDRVKRALWRVIARDMLISAGLHRLPKDLRPAHPLPHHLAHAGVMPRGYARAVRRGLVDARLGTVTAFTPTGVRLATDEEIPADVVVLATGHRKVFPFLDPRVRTHDDAGRVRLFRGIVAPGADRLAFSGFRQIFNNILGVELTAHWIAAHFLGTLRVTPDEDATDARMAWQERVLPGSGGYDLGPYDIHSADELMHDMGLPTRRAGNPFAEHLLPGGVARRYKGLQAP